VPPAEAAALSREIGRNLSTASRQTGRTFAVVSRSDSTLRGHFPGEVDALVDGLGGPFDAWLVIPFFLEGGRYTINDVHYVLDGASLVPAAQTESARDAAFGYRSSNLREWVEEKTAGRVRAGDVAAISLEDIRCGGPPRVTERLAALAAGSVCIVNAAGYRDLEVFVRGLLEAEAAGRRFLYRTAASFVRVRAGIAPRPLLKRADLALEDTGGALVVVGSYVPRTTSQLMKLLEKPGILPVKIDVTALLDSSRRAREITQTTEAAGAGLVNGRDVVMYTSRTLVTAADAESNLSVGRQVSQALVSIVRALGETPRYILAKGGITASDLATDALAVRRAEVLGQILPGVPVWRLGRESTHPGLTYIVFPGNVGSESALAETVAALSR
jgi:uncharacterized protein YgbK (DUF1537 family)